MSNPMLWRLRAGGRRTSRAGGRRFGSARGRGSGAASSRSCGMIVHHIGAGAMASVKVAITLERETLLLVDSLVSRRVFPNRSRAIQIALREKIERLEGGRQAAECAKLDPAF